MSKMWLRSSSFNVKIMLYSKLSQAIGSVSSGNLSGFWRHKQQRAWNNIQYCPRSFVSFQNLVGFYGRQCRAADIVNISNQASCPWQHCSFNVKGAMSRYFRQFQHWSNCHRINLNIKITAQNYRRTRTKHSKDKKGSGWTKLERMEVDCIWTNLKNVGPPFFKFTVCQFIHVSNFR